MKETDDGKTIDGQDGGAIPPISTKPDDYFYTQREWDRVVGIGRVPDDRDSLKRIRG